MHVLCVNSYFFEHPAPCRAECKGIAGSRGREAAARTAVLPGRRRGRATRATCRRYQV